MIDTMYLNDSLVFYHQTSQFSTGNAFVASAGPTYRVYANQVGTPILTGAMTALDAADVTGLYSGSIVLSTANGFAVGNSYVISTGATVNAVTARGIAAAFILRNPVPTDVWNAAEFGCSVGYAGTMGAQMAQLWRSVANLKIANGATFTIYCDDNTTVMLSGAVGMGPTTSANMWQGL